MAKKTPHMDPNQMDRWWKNRIEKEEICYGDKSGKEKEKFNILTHSAVDKDAVPAAKQEQQPNAPPTPTLLKGLKVDVETGSLASVRSQAKSAAGSQAGSKAGSSVEIMNRLARLEKDLKSERDRRLKAESELKDLLGGTPAE